MSINNNTNFNNEDINKNNIIMNSNKGIENNEDEKSIPQEEQIEKSEDSKSNKSFENMNQKQKYFKKKYSKDEERDKTDNNEGAVRRPKNNKVIDSKFRYLDKNKKILNDDSGSGSGSESESGSGIESGEDEKLKYIKEQLKKKELNKKYDDEKLLQQLLELKEKEANNENLNYLISMFFNQLGNVVDEVCAEKNINSFVVQRVKLYLFLKVAYKLFFSEVFQELNNKGIIKEDTVLENAIKILGGKRFSNIFLEEFVEDFPSLNQRTVTELSSLEDNAEIVKEVIKRGVPLEKEKEPLKILSLKISVLSDTPQYSNRLNRIKDGSTTGFELKDLDSNILPYSVNFASIYNEINRKTEDFFKRIGFLNSFKDVRAIQVLDVLKATKTEVLKRMSSLSNTRDNKIKEIFAEKGGRFSKLLKEEFAEEKSSIKATATEFSDLNSLISNISREKNKFENLSKELKKKGEDFEVSKSDVVLRKEMFFYVSKMQNLMKNTEEILSDLQKDADSTRADEFNLSFNVEKLRNAKINYGKKLAQFLDVLVKRKYSKELKFVENLNGLNVNVDFEALEKAYDNFIVAMINKKGLVSLDEIKKCCKAIGYELNEWNILNYAPQEALLRASKGSELKNLNQQIALLLSKLSNTNGFVLRSSIVKMFRERAARDLMTIYSLRNVVQPMVDILGFNFLNMKSKKDCEKIKFELTDIKTNNVKDTLINFIDTFLNLNNGSETFEGMSLNRNGFYFDFQDKSLKGIVNYLRKLISNFGSVNLETLFENNNVKEEDVEQDNDDDNNDNDDEEKEEVPVSSTDTEEVRKNTNELKVKTTEIDDFLDDGSKNGYIVPLMGTEKHNIQNAQCEYKYEADNSVLLFLKGVEAKQDCGIIAVPLREGKEGTHVRLSDNVGLLPFLVRSSMNEVHFYYSKPNDPSTDVDPQAFIGSIRLTYLDKTTARAGLYPKQLNIKPIFKNNNKDNIVIGGAIFDFSDKIILYYNAPVYPGNVLFIATNKDCPPVERMRYSIVQTKNNYIAVVFDDVQMLNKLGDNFEIHMYNGELVESKFIVKFLIDRNDVVTKNEEKKVAKVENKVEKDDKEKKETKEINKKKKTKKKEKKEKENFKINNNNNLLNMRLFEDDVNEDDFDLDFDSDF